MTLAEKIAALRAERRLSQGDLAARLDVSRQAVSKWELGDATPEVDKLLALARAFGVTTDELLSGEEPAGTGEQALPPRKKPAPTAPGETHLDRQGWVHNAFVLSLGVCAIGLLMAVGGGANDTSAGPAVIGLIIQLGGVLVFELAAPRMGERCGTARLSFYSIACWLVVPVLTIALNRWAFWRGRAVWWSLGEYLLLDLLLSGAVTAVLLALRRRKKNASAFGQKDS